jgi:SAM-dependent MidA family methyltransferase
VAAQAQQLLAPAEMCELFKVTESGNGADANRQGFAA